MDSGAKSLSPARAVTGASAPTDPETLAQTETLLDETALSADGGTDQTAVEIAASRPSLNSLAVPDTKTPSTQKVRIRSLRRPARRSQRCPKAHRPIARHKEGKAELTGILKVHVAEGTVLAGEVALAGRKNEGPR